MTISLDDADGSSIAYKAHKLILSLASPVLKDLMEEHETAEDVPLAGGGLPRHLPHVLLFS